MSSRFGSTSPSGRAARGKTRSSRGRDGIRRPGVRFKRGRTRPSGPPFFLLIIAATLILGFILVIQFGRTARRNRGAEDRSGEIHSNPLPPPTLASVLEETWISLGARVVEHPAPRGGGGDGSRLTFSQRVYLPPSVTLLMANQAVSGAARRAKAKVVEARETRSPPGASGGPPSGLSMEIDARGEAVYLLTLEPDPRLSNTLPARPAESAEIPDGTLYVTPSTPRLALIIDDMGYSLNSTARGLLDLPWPLAVAIIPGTPSAGVVAEAARQGGREILLHLPMEPWGYPEQDPGPFGILVSYSRRQVRKALAAALESVPGAVGVNNHMGSRATEDEGLMGMFLAEVQAQGLFVVDSKTSPSSVVYDIAPRLGLRCLENDLFIDDETRDEKVIEERLRRLGLTARRRGHALGIGHPHPSTLTALRETLPALEREGIRVVPLKELITPGGPS